MLLADDLGERAGAVAAVERGAGGHGESSLSPTRASPERIACCDGGCAAPFAGIDAPRRVALRLTLPFGFPNYDTLYSLVWGQQLARGQTPAYSSRSRRRRTRCSSRSA